MKQINYRMLQQSAKWMKDLPVELVRYGKVIAIIQNPTVTLKTTSPTAKIKKLENPIIAEPTKPVVAPVIEEFPEPVPVEPDALQELARIARPVMWKCHHGMAGRLCKDSKCRTESIKHR